MENKNNDSTEEIVRLNRFLAISGIASRRKADELIQSGAISINGKVVIDLGTKVNLSKDSVSFGGQKLRVKIKKIYLLFNKPKDCITTLKDEFGRTSVMDYIKLKERVYPIGRLDRNTTGVLLLTNDGDLANKLMHPKNEITKTYKASIDKNLESADRIKLEKGVYLEEGKTSPAKIEFLNKRNEKEVYITIHEGKNRQIHRMFLGLGYEVKKLERINYAGLTSKGVERGNWRFLTELEIKKLKK